MAAGLSMPGLIIDIIGAFISVPDDKGIGKIVGSLTFNLLILLGISGCIGGRVESRYSLCTICGPENGRSVFLQTCHFRVRILYNFKNSMILKYIHDRKSLR